MMGGQGAAGTDLDVVGVGADRQHHQWTRRSGTLSTSRAGQFRCPGDQP